jgi:type II secretion system protein N
MDKKTLAENSLDEEIYSESNSPNKLIYPISFAILILAFVFNFPVKPTITSLVKKGLSLNKNCSVVYDDFEITTFPPGLSFKNLALPGKCFNKRSGKLDFKTADFNISTPNFSDFGIKFFGNLTNGATNINMYPTIALGNKLILKIDKSTIDLSQFSDLTNGITHATGNVTLQLLAKVDGQKLDSATISAKSKNLKIPSQVLGGGAQGMSLAIPSIFLQNFDLKAKLIRGTDLDIVKLTLGNSEAPVFANFTGKITLNQKLPGKSKLDIKGELQFSEEFLKSFVILKLFLAKFESDNDTYKIKIKGTLDNPQALP